jgi:hypothetical protein
VNHAEGRNGESAERRVRAELGPDGRLERLHLDPRALRLGSADLAAQIVAAVRTAQDAWAEPRPEPAGAGPDAEDVTRRLEEIQASAESGFSWLMTALDETLRRLDDV